MNGNHPSGVIARHPVRWDRHDILLLLATTMANKAVTFLGLFTAQALSWAGVPALGAAAAGAAGALASQGELHLWAVIAVGTAGAEAGGVLGWWIGHRVTRAGLTPNPDDGSAVDRSAVEGDASRHEGRFTQRRRAALAAGEKVERKWGRLIVFFVPSWVSGALGMPVRQFAFWNLISAILWNVGASLASYGLASAVSGASLTKILIPLAIGVAALAVIAWLLRTLVRRVRQYRRHPPADPAGGLTPDAASVPGGSPEPGR